MVEWKLTMTLSIGLLLPFAFRPGSSLLTIALTSPIPSGRLGRTPSRSFSSYSYDGIPSLYEEQEKMLVRRGQLEGEIMGANSNTTPLGVTVAKGAGAGGGFGGGGSSKKKLLKEQGKVLAKTLRTEGVVRIDNVLPDTLADELREFVYSLRMESEDKVRTGKVQPIERFADVLLKENRCDLTMPLGPTLVGGALHSLLNESPVSSTISTILGNDAIFHEFSCLMSDPGSQRQVVHPDTPIREGEEAVLYTCFVALQDIEPTMGPTTWLPNSHTASVHEDFQEEVSYGEESRKDKLLRNHPAVIGVLPKGSCSIFDSRLLHCGGANKSETSRALFYFSFKNPSVGYTGNPASIRREVAAEKYTLAELQMEMKLCAKGKPSKRLLGISS